MKKTKLNMVGIMLILTYVAQGAIAHLSVAEEHAAPLPTVETEVAVAAMLAETEQRMSRKAGEIIEQRVEETMQRLDRQMDSRINGKLELTMLTHR